MTISYDPVNHRLTFSNVTCTRMMITIGDNDPFEALPDEGTIEISSIALQLGVVVTYAEIEQGAPDTYVIPE